MCIDNNKALYEQVNDYLSSGVASGKWEERGRLESLRNFMDKHMDNLRKILVNLASEMAKNCGNKR